MNEKQLEKLTIEQSFDKVEEIIRKLETQEISLEESFKQYKIGIEYLNQCNKNIQNIENQVMLLNEIGRAHV